MDDKKGSGLDEQQLKFLDWWSSLAWSDLLGVVLILLLTPALIWAYARAVSGSPTRTRVCDWRCWSACR